MVTATTRIDPTRTTSIRRQWEQDFSRRFNEVAREVVKLVDDEDVFGLKERAPFTALAEEFRFQTDEQKLKSFRAWLTKMTDAKILRVEGPKGKPWLAKYVDSSYRKGIVRAFVDARGKELKAETFFAGQKDQFLRSAFASSEKLSKIEFLATRAFEDLRGVTAQMASQMNRILALGLANGQHPTRIAKELAANVTGISKRRALVIARTEVVAAHAEGQLDGFEDLNVQGVGTIAEWVTAGDDKVCRQCAAMQGMVFKIEDARGLIPKHPNCRCAWIPADVEERRPRRVSKKRKREEALEKNLGGGESAQALMDRLLAEGRTDDEIFGQFRELYAKQGKTDETWIRSRIAIYKRISEKVSDGRR